MISKKFPKCIHEALGHYVYVYVNKDNGEILYVGKGQGNRCFEHLNAADGKDKTETFNELYAKDILRIDILAYNLDEVTALKVEAATIDLTGLENLYNEKRGKDSREYGRITTDDLIAKLDATEILSSEIKDDCILIRINHSYRSGMPPLELYEATRGVWKASLEKCEKVKFAMSVYQGVIREVYDVKAWFPGGSTMYSTRESFPHDDDWNSRVEFVGRVADDDIRKKYIHKNIVKIWSNGAQNPIRYIGPSFRKDDEMASVE